MNKKKLLFIVITIVAMSALLIATLLPIAAAGGTAQRQFTVNTESASTVIGGTLTFAYSGATIGPDEYISAIIKDMNGNIVYQTSLKNTTAASDESGIVSMVVPNLPGETYDLYLFTENKGAAGGSSAQHHITLKVYPDPYITSPSELPATTQGVNYKNFRLAAESNASGLTWSVESGSLPAGMSLNSSTGAIVGSATKAGSYSFTIKASTGSSFHSKAFTLQVNPPLSISFASSVTSGSFTKLSIPRNRTVTLSASVSGGTSPYSQTQWSVNGMPISGATSSTYTIPTDKLGTYIYTFSVSDMATANTSASITVEIREPINPTTSITNIQYDKSNPTPVTFNKNDGDYTLDSIKSGNTVLNKDTQYTINGDTVTLTKELLDKLQLGQNDITLDYSDTTADPKITITVIDSSLPPVIGTLVTPSAIDRGQKLDIKAPSVTTYGTPITAQGWKVKLSGATSFTDFSIISPLECNYNKATVYYYATNTAGTTNSNEVVITVNHTPSKDWSRNKTEHWHVCECGQKFDLGPHTCNAAGDCTVCGYHCTHKYGAYKSDNNATCTTDSTSSRTCTLCGYVDTVVNTGTKLGHAWSIWQLSPTEHWKVCTRCSIKSNQGAHVPGPPATTTSPQTCTVCGMMLEDKLSGSDTTVPGGNTPGTTVPGGDTPGTTVPGGDTPGTTVPGGDTPGTTVPGGDTPGTTVPGGDTPGTTVPGGNTPGTTVPGGDTPDTTVPGGNTSDTTVPGGNTPDSTTPGINIPDVPLDPNDTSSSQDTTGPDGDVTTGPSDTSKPNIDIDRKPGDTNDDAPTFITDSDLSSIIIITIDKRPLTKDEYTVTVKPDGSEIVIHPITPIGPGDHTLSIETETGKGEVDFEIGDQSGIVKVAFPFWLLWVVPHVLADIFGIVLIIILVTKKKEDEDAEAEPTNETNN